MSVVAISTALDAFMMAWPTQIDMAWEGVLYTPVTNRPYIEPRLSGYSRKPAGFGRSTGMLETGTYTVTIKWPVGEGKQNLLQMAGQLEAYFPRGMTLALATGQVLTIDYASAERLSDDDAWLICPVTVFWMTNE